MTSKKRGAPMVDPADVQRFIDDVLMKDAIFARAPDADNAYTVALAVQNHRERHSKNYYEEFARQVRERVKWLKPASPG